MTKYLGFTPINDTQREFVRLCELGGGPKGGPARTRVVALLRESGLSLNKFAFDEITEYLKVFSDRSAWHVCYAMGLCWGHLAKLDPDFIDAASRLMSNWNDDDLKTALRFHLERGRSPVEFSLRGGHILFGKVTLPPGLPTSIVGYRRAQDRWLSPILSKERPKYIGSWNATAMFMVGLFSNPKLAEEFLSSEFMLPPSGAIFRALQALSSVGFLSRPPSGSELDDEAFEPGSLYENNKFFDEIIRGTTGWNLLDVHSGLYMLGTKEPRSQRWLEN